MIGESWTNAIASLNQYVSDLRSKKVVGTIHVTAFDSIYAVDGYKSRLITIVNTSIGNYEPLDVELIIKPEGGTPLYDAAAHVMDLASQANSDRTIIVILTDGHENSSKEYTREKIKARVEDMQNRNWEVIFLGANFDVATYTQQAGLSTGKFANFDLNDVNSRTATFGALSSSSFMYATAGTAIDLSKETL